LAADVIHVLDAIDGLFERRRDGAGYRVGRSAGIRGGDLDGWKARAERSSKRTLAESLQFYNLR
jgi:hypothetical protein